MTVIDKTIVIHSQPEDLKPSEDPNQSQKFQTHPAPSTVTIWCNPSNVQSVPPSFGRKRIIVIHSCIIHQHFDVFFFFSLSKKANTENALLNDK